MKAYEVFYDNKVMAMTKTPENIFGAELLETYPLTQIADDMQALPAFLTNVLSMPGDRYLQMAGANKRNPLSGLHTALVALGGHVRKTEKTDKLAEDQILCDYLSIHRAIEELGFTDEELGFTDPRRVFAQYAIAYVGTLAHQAIGEAYRRKDDAYVRNEAVADPDDATRTDKLALVEKHRVTIGLVGGATLGNTLKALPEVMTLRQLVTSNVAPTRSVALKNKDKSKPTNE